MVIKLNYVTVGQWPWFCQWHSYHCWVGNFSDDSQDTLWRNEALFPMASPVCRVWTYGVNILFVHVYWEEIDKHGGTEERKERALQRRNVIVSLGHIMNGNNVNIEVKRDLRSTGILPTLTYASETWTWNESQRSRVQAVEMSPLRRSACGV